MSSKIALIKDYDLQNINKYVSNIYNYGLSKLCMILFTLELAKNIEGTGVTTYSLHPGSVATDILKLKPGFVSSLLKIAGKFIKVFTT